MLRVTPLFVLSILYTLPSWAQSVGTDPDPTRWINYSQHYYKLPTAQAGLYRITTAELRQAGVPVGSVDPTTIQLFHRGQEQAIYVAGETDRRIDADDFLEFYGRGNDGAQDSLLYRTDDGSLTSAQPHTYYSLFTDTTAYFLTWRLDGKPGRRMAEYTEMDETGLTPEPYHWAEKLRLFTDNYPGWAAGIPPKIEYSYYEAGEGYTGVVQQKDKPFDNAFTLTSAVRDGPSPLIDILLAGRDYTTHRVECRVGGAVGFQRLVDTLHFAHYNNARLKRSLSWTDVGPNGQLVVSTVSRGENDAPDRYSASYIRLRYPQTLTANGESLRWWQLRPNPLDRSLLILTNLPAGTRFWNITDPTAPTRIGTTTAPIPSTHLIVRNTQREQTIFSTSQPQSVSSIRPVTFKNLANRKPTYLIVSHEALMRPIDSLGNVVQAYAAYRASAAGGSHDTLVVTMQELIDQFSYGERHPLAIRRFADQMIRQSNGATQYLLLLGRSRSTPGIRRDPNQAILDMVMTGGFPGSDVVFTAGLNGQPRDVPALPTGRVNAGTPQEVLDYLNKVKEYERLPSDTPWRKNVLHLSGGDTPDQARLFRSLVDAYQAIATRPALGAAVTTLTKQTDNPVERIDVVKPVNAGLGLITFFGHSGLDVTDLDIGFCSNDALGYANRGKYPVLLINGCAVGNFFFGRPTLTTDWVLTPDRGAIAAIAQSHLGYVDYLDQYSTRFYELIADSTWLDKSIGQLQQETIRRVLAQSATGNALANCQQMVLQGDPAIRLFPFQTPDYAITATDLQVRGMGGQPLTTLSDSVQIQAIIQNVGQYRASPLPVRIRRLGNDRELSVFNLTLRTVANRDTVTVNLPNDRNTDGLNQFELTINPPGRNGLSGISETNHRNNQAVVEVLLTSQKPVLIYPATGSRITTKTPRLTAQYIPEGQHTFVLELDTTVRFDSPNRLIQRIRTESTISYPASLPDLPETTYYWRVRLADDDRATSDKWSVGWFTYAPNSLVMGLPEGQFQLTGLMPTGVQQGDVVTISGQFINLSPYPFRDSIVVRQVIYAANLPNPQITQWKLAPLDSAPPEGADTLRITSRIPTQDLPGLNRIMLTVNPHIQAEHSFLNNTITLALAVEPDVLGPILEVAFDGARIDDGDPVSARPLLDVLVADNNRALIRRDTTGLALYLQRPGPNQPFSRLNWRNATVRAAGADNLFRIRYPMPLLPDGSYRLLVTARDAVGNAAEPYQVSFRVVGNRMLTDLTVYPNPFRDRVLFAFRLTGDQAPDVVTITITDLSGRVVRQLRGDQPGLTSRVGLNEWVWDGQNETHEPLPAGLYLYKLTAETAGQTWPIDDTLTNRLRGRLVLSR